jgi:hypothetical protein
VSGAAIAITAHMEKEKIAGMTQACDCPAEELL